MDPLRGNSDAWPVISVGTRAAAGAASVEPLAVAGVVAGLAPATGEGAEGASGAAVSNAVSAPMSRLAGGEPSASAALAQPAPALAPQGGASAWAAAPVPDASAWGEAPAGYQAASQVALSGDRAVDALLRGTKWGSSTPGEGITLTYSFRTPATVGIAPGVPTYDDNPWFLNEAAQSAVRLALEQWSTVANIRFVEVPETAQSQGDIRFGGTHNLPSGTIAESNFPQGGFQDFDGDVWLGSAIESRAQNASTELAPGTLGFMTLVHEIGHSLGLKHPFQAAGTNATTLPAAQDNQRNTVMSYDYEYAIFAHVPQQLDVAAIQYLYGPNLDYNSGDTTYSFDPSQPAFLSLWDAGGINTLDASNQWQSVALDLNASARSSLGATNVDQNDGPEYGLRSSDYFTLAPGTVMHNAIGSVFDDILIGNEQNNRLEGAAGFDFIRGGEGYDVAVFRAPAEALAGMQVINDPQLPGMRHVVSGSGRLFYDVWQDARGRVYVADVRAPEDIPAGQTSQGIDVLEGVEEIQIQPGGGV